MMNFHDMLFLFCVSLMFISIMHIVFFSTMISVYVYTV